MWLRTADRLPDDPLLQVCAVTYASDMTLLDSVLLAHGLAWEMAAGSRGQPRPRDVVPPSVPGRRLAALRPVVPVAGGARGLAIGRLWTRDGRHVVSVVQEGLLRVTDDETDTSR